MFSGKDDLRGVASSRVRRPYKLFETLLDDALGDRVRADGACGVDLWCAADRHPSSEAHARRARYPRRWVE